MFEVISGELIKALQDYLRDLPKENISTKKPEAKKPAVPAISVSSADFKMEDVGLGGGGTEAQEETEENFSGDGKTSAFTLTQRPLRPLLAVEAPGGEPRKEKDDFLVDYKAGTLTFRTPPPKGKDTILVRYVPVKTAGETKLLRLSITYHVDVWANDETRRDNLAVDAIKSLLIAQEGLARKGIRVRPIGGLNFEPPQNGADGILAKRLIYNVESEMEVKLPIPPIERIEIEWKPKRLRR